MNAVVRRSFHCVNVIWVLIKHKWRPAQVVSKDPKKHLHNESIAEQRHSYSKANPFFVFYVGVLGAPTVLLLHSPSCDGLTPNTIHSTGQKEESSYAVASR
jgi:hypothetical protein